MKTRKQVPRVQEAITTLIDEMRRDRREQDAMSHHNNNRVEEQ